MLEVGEVVHRFGIAWGLECQGYVVAVAAGTAYSMDVDSVGGVRRQTCKIKSCVAHCVFGGSLNGRGYGCQPRGLVAYRCDGEGGGGWRDIVQGNRERIGASDIRPGEGVVGVGSGPLAGRPTGGTAVSKVGGGVIGIDDPAVPDVVAKTPLGISVGEHAGSFGRENPHDVATGIEVYLPFVLLSTVGTVGASHSQTELNNQQGSVAGVDSVLGIDIMDGIEKGTSGAEEVYFRTVDVAGIGIEWRVVAARTYQPGSEPKITVTVDGILGVVGPGKGEYESNVLQG